MQKNIEAIVKDNRNMTLLYVEDDLLSRELVSEILKDLFPNIIMAKNGKEGLEKFRTHKIDLIISDIYMPVMGGLEMIQTIRETNQEVAIIMLSAYSETEYFLKGIEYGVDGYLLKPFNLEQFTATLGNILRGVALKRELYSLHERMDLVLHGNQVFIFEWDFLQKTLYLSPHWKVMFGYGVEELEDQLDAWKALLSVEEYEAFALEAKRRLEKKEHYFEHTYCISHKEGGVVWVLVSAQIFYDDKGTPIRMVGTHTNITKEKKYQRVIEEQHQYLQSIIDGLNDSIMVINEDYSVPLMNKTRRKHIENPEAIDSDNPKCYEIAYQRKTPCELSERSCPLREVLETQSHSVMIHERSNNKQRRYIEISASPLFNKEKVFTGIVAAARDITSHLETKEALEEQKDVLHHQAHHDALTGLPNRVLFYDRLAHGIERSKRHNSALALFFIDLDHFKEINDSLGHGMGDEVLKLVTKRLLAVIRKEDTLSRLGGDEFTIIIEDIEDSESISLLAEKMLESLTEPLVLDETTLYVSCSIGISLYPSDGTTAQDLLKYADAAMYRAKEEGRNNFQFYSQEMTSLAMDRVVMEAALRESLKREDFEVYYQPQVDACSEKLIGMEALVRWNHPTHKKVTPATFIPLAETTGLIVALDRFVMKSAMSQLVAWYDMGLNPGVLTLNLSFRQFQKKGFIAYLQEVMKETRCRAQWLEFEVTEGQIMSHPEESIDLLNQINALGIGLSVDDFGTGYSSLAYLKKLPIQKLKIDQSFIQNLPHDEEDAAITKTVIVLAKSLNLKVIAEGVETLEQKNFLVEHGCPDIQGYLFSKPMPATQMRAYLKANLS